MVRVAAVLLLAVALVVGCNDSRGLTARDRVPLVERDVAGTLRLVHPTLGFSIVRPPGFTASKTTGPMLASLFDGAIGYGYNGRDGSVSLVVAPGADLDASVRRLREGFDRSMPPPVQWPQTDVGPDDAHLHAISTPTHVRIASHRLRDRGLIVHVVVTSNDGGAMSDVLDSFRREQDAR